MRMVSSRLRKRLRSTVITDFAPPRKRQKGNVGYQPVPISRNRVPATGTPDRAEMPHHQTPVVDLPLELVVEPPQPAGVLLHLVVQRLAERDEAERLLYSSLESPVHGPSCLSLASKNARRV